MQVALVRKTLAPAESLHSPWSKWAAGRDMPAGIKGSGLSGDTGYLSAYFQGTALWKGPG